MKAIQCSVPLVCQRDTSLIDALPYADDDCEETMSAATRLIEEEMKAMPATNYLADLPPPPVTEITNYACKRARERPKVDPQTVSEANLQYGYRYIQSVNLELLLEYGPEGWEKHIEVLEAYKARLETSVKVLQEANEKTNRERMQGQIRAKETLRMLHEQWKVLCHKGRALHKETKRLKGVVEARRKRRLSQPTQPF